MIQKTTHEGDAAKQAFAEFLSGRTLTANQIESIDRPALLIAVYGF